ncbi:MAG: hypothetical protein Q9227_008074 [Pyrenula ochraceoflavens]
MALRGERFELELSDDDQELISGQSKNAPSSNVALVGEIKERSGAAPPTMPAFKNAQNGFPQHKKRFQSSKSKQSRSNARTDTAALQGTPKAPYDRRQPSDREIVHRLQDQHGLPSDRMDREEIDKENKLKIAQMSEEEIEDARAELMASLNPTLIQKLMKKATIDETYDKPDVQRSIGYEDYHEEKSEPRKQQLNCAHDDNTQPKSSMKLSSSSSSKFADRNGSQASSAPFHFPSPPKSSTDYQPLDPSSSSFLTDLHKHYFPETPHDPSSLAWLNDPSTDENTYTNSSSVPVSQIRFSFNGTIIPPSTSESIPVTAGLHHHGLSPSSAGYTVPELALLGRSSFPSQRCVAWMILGRLLYRLGKREFGEELTDELWKVVKKETVIEVMTAEAAREGGHASAKAYAVEGLWLWRRGGEGPNRGTDLQTVNEESESGKATEGGGWRSAT